jgi:subtilisin-like proprotein convertase family protein
VYTGAGFTIPDNVPAGVSSVISVVGDTRSITSIEVTLTGMVHTWVGDLNARLTSPSGTVFPLFIRIGRTLENPGAGSAADLFGDYVFTDTATTSLWVPAATVGSGPIQPGAYRTSGPRSAAATSLNGAFAGQNSNGQWRLSISDNAGADLGRLQSWSLSIVPAPGSLAIFGIAGLAAARRRR